MSDNKQGLLLRVGETLPSPYDDIHSMGAILDMKKDGIMIAALVDNATPEEIECAASEKMTIGLLQHRDAVFFLLFFGRSLVFDCSWDATKVHPDDKGLPYRDEGSGLTFSVIFGDCIDKKIKALRFATTTPQFSRTLELLVQKMNQRAESGSYDFMASYQEALAKYPRPDMMMDDCLIVETAGRDFDEIDQTMSKAF